MSQSLLILTALVLGLTNPSTGGAAPTRAPSVPPLFDILDKDEAASTRLFASTRSFAKRLRQDSREVEAMAKEFAENLEAWILRVAKVRTDATAFRTTDIAAIVRKTLGDALDTGSLKSPDHIRAAAFILRAFQENRHGTLQRLGDAVPARYADLVAATKAQLEAAVVDAITRFDLERAAAPLVTRVTSKHEDNLIYVADQITRDLRAIRDLDDSVDPEAVAHLAHAFSADLFVFMDTVRDTPFAVDITSERTDAFARNIHALVIKAFEQSAAPAAARGQWIDEVRRTSRLMRILNKPISYVLKLHPRTREAAKDLRVVDPRFTKMVTIALDTQFKTPLPSAPVGEAWKFDDTLFQDQSASIRAIAQRLLQYPPHAGDEAVYPAVVFSLAQEIDRLGEDMDYRRSAALVVLRVSEWVRRLATPIESPASAFNQPEELARFIIELVDESLDKDVRLESKRRFRRQLLERLAVHVRIFRTSAVLNAIFRPISRDIKPPAERPEYLGLGVMVQTRDLVAKSCEEKLTP